MGALTRSDCHYISAWASFPPACSLQDHLRFIPLCHGAGTLTFCFPCARVSAQPSPALPLLPPTRQKLVRTEWNALSPTTCEQYVVMGTCKPRRVTPLAHRIFPGPPSKSPRAKYPKVPIHQHFLLQQQRISVSTRQTANLEPDYHRRLEQKRKTALTSRKSDLGFQRWARGWGSSTKNFRDQRQRSAAKSRNYSITKSSNSSVRFCARPGKGHLQLVLDLILELPLPAPGSSQRKCSRPADPFRFISLTACAAELQRCGPSCLGFTACMNSTRPRDPL